jgi:methionyl-tRNA formyltransferase
VRVAFLGSPPFATPILARLFASAFRPVVVVTQPDRPRGRGRQIEPGAVAALALSERIPLLQPESTRAAEFVAALRGHAPDVLLVAAYGEILREDVLALAPRGPFNVHASLLPRWRGASPIQQAILQGDARTGVTIQRMVRALDAGDIVLQRELEIGTDESAGELAVRLAALGADAAVEALERIESGRATYTPQDPDRISVCRKLDKQAGHVDWTRPATEIARLVRAMHPWPAARTALLAGGNTTAANTAGAHAAEPEVLSILRARVEHEQASAERPGPEPSRPEQPGTILRADTRLCVACGVGTLELLEVQSAGRKPLDAAAWLRGAHLPERARLESLPRS